MLKPGDPIHRATACIKNLPQTPRRHNWKQTIITTVGYNARQLRVPETPICMGSVNGEGKGDYNTHPNVSHSIEPKTYE
jgi:hypothetical protein